mmetsp:Transcript_27374/g.62835  ORF Transcript_27374/g.62835 Transcript_27374/m.62835 type:complete len:279 (+) Transcript_27374:434-1270(+)
MKKMVTIFVKWKILSRRPIRKNKRKRKMTTNQLRCPRHPRWERRRKEADHRPPLSNQTRRMMTLFSTMYCFRFHPSPKTPNQKRQPPQPRSSRTKTRICAGKNKHPSRPTPPPQMPSTKTPSTRPKRSHWPSKPPCDALAATNRPKAPAPAEGSRKPCAEKHPRVSRKIRWNCTTTPTTRRPPPSKRRSAPPRPTSRRGKRREDADGPSPCPRTKSRPTRRKRKRTRRRKTTPTTTRKTWRRPRTSCAPPWTSPPASRPPWRGSASCRNTLPTRTRGR